jgi:hypothetical protein
MHLAYGSLGRQPIIRTAAPKCAEQLRVDRLTVMLANLAASVTGAEDPRRPC